MQRPIDVRQLEADAYVDSPRNQRVRDVARLYKRRERGRRGRLVAEGVWALRTALEAGTEIDDVYYCTDFFNGGEVALLARARSAGAQLTRLSERALRRLSFRDGPDGIVCVVRKPDSALDSSHLGPVPLVCVTQAIEKPGNLGAIIRTACAANADMVIVCDPLTDAYAPAVVRASLGSIFLIPVVISSTEEAMAWLRDEGIATYATTPQGDHDPWSADLTRPAAIVIGNEHSGLDEPWLRRADVQLRIPMLGPMNSLNASTAAGIVLFEAVRQRGVSRRDC